MTRTVDACTDWPPRARAAFVGEYVGPDGRMTSDAQTAYALAIGFDLVPPALRTAAGGRLAELVDKADGRISTGFGGTPLVCDALTATGHEASAYRLLLQEHAQSWLHTVRQGPTTARVRRFRRLFMPRPTGKALEKKP